MRSSSLGERVALGSGVVADFVWGEGDPAVPSAVTVRHPCGARLYAPWAPAPGLDHPVFTLVSLVPLELAERLVCARCGGVGRIVRGAWVPE